MTRAVATKAGSVAAKNATVLVPSGSNVVAPGLPSPAVSPSDANATVLLGILRNADKYTVGTWYPATYGSQSGSTYLSFGTSPAENELRPPASAAFALAISLATGAYSATHTGVSEADARAIAIRLAVSVAKKHISNNGAGSTSWGITAAPPTVNTTGWQDSLWAYYACIAGWLNWSTLTTSERTAISQMAVAEANRYLSYTVPYQYTRTGFETFAGDTKAEESAWNGAMVDLACLMMPAHANVTTWRAKAREMMVGALARQLDLTSSTVFYDKQLGAWLRGYNIAADGTLVNHGFIHPDYMVAAVGPLLQATLRCMIGSTATPSLLHNVGLLYGALSTVNFTSPPYAAPGGTMYVAGQSAPYYPEGTDWGTARVANFACMDVMADAFGIDAGLPHTAAYWANLRLQAWAAQQARGTTGQTYQDGDADTYAGREQWSATHAAYAWAAAWAKANGRLTASTEQGSPAVVAPVLSGAATPSNFALSWTSDNSHASYEVYSSTTSTVSTSGTPLATVTTAAYNAASVTEGQSIYFAVVAKGYGASPPTSAASNVVQGSVYVAPTGSPTRPSTQPATTAPTLWLRGDAITGVSNNAPISTWTATTGSDAVTQTLNSGTNPTVLVDVLGTGRHAVRFVAANVQKMRVPFSLTSVANTTVLVVFRAPSLAATVNVVHGVSSDVGAVNGRLRAQVSTDGKFMVYAFNNGTPSQTATGVVAANTWYVATARYNTNRFAQARLGNTQASFSSGAMVAGASADLALGGYGTGTSTIDIAEVIAFPTYLSDSDVVLWLTYLGTTWNITIS